MSGVIVLTEEVVNAPGFDLEAVRIHNAACRAKELVDHKARARLREERRARHAPYTLKPTPLRTPTKHWRPAKLLEAVRAIVVAKIAEKSWYITAESVAKELRAKKSMVSTTFIKLGQEGLVGHKARSCPHDNEWTPSPYVLLPFDRHGH